MQRNLRNMFHRMGITEQDVRTLRGAIVRLVGRAARGAEDAAAPPPARRSGSQSRREGEDEHVLIVEVDLFGRDALSLQRDYGNSEHFRACARPDAENSRIRFRPRRADRIRRDPRGTARRRLRLCGGRCRFSLRPASTRRELIARVGEVMEELVAACRPDLVVIACNTASTLVLPAFARAFPALPFVGTVPGRKAGGDAIEIASDLGSGNARHGRARLYARPHPPICGPL